jgi:hypothetical protein
MPSEFKDVSKSNFKRILNEILGQFGVLNI